jgi:prepilin-type N-terminal cleavage/methylation domain-containing protein
VTLAQARQAGFSLVELLVATLLVSIVGLMVMSFVSHGFRVARARPEAGDLHQRLRVAAETIANDLRQAGAGLAHGEDAGSLSPSIAPIVPARTGALSPDPAVSAFADRISIFYAPEGAWQGRLSADLTDPTASVPVDPASPRCPAAGLCGFADGSRAILLDRTGPDAGYDAFTVTGIAGALTRGSPNPLLSRPYVAADTLLLPIVQRVYYLDRSQRRLMLYDGYVTDLPLVDNVTDLSFSYFVSPSAGDVPPPPDGGTSCLYTGSPPAPTLTDFGGLTPRRLGLAELQDGPICGTGPSRFDGDLLRIRRVRVTLRLDVSSDDLRGTAPAYSRAGRAQAGDSLVPDYEVSFDVWPQNLWPIR